LPVHLYETISRIKENNSCFHKKWVASTEEEIATRMEMTIEKLRFIAKSAQLPISLETPIGKRKTPDWAILLSPMARHRKIKFLKSPTRRSRKVLDSLSPRERDVLRLRYGL